jgi:hypothetical protein
VLLLLLQAGLGRLVGTGTGGTTTVRACGGRRPADEAVLTSWESPFFRFEGRAARPHLLVPPAPIAGRIDYPRPYSLEPQAWRHLEWSIYDLPSSASSSSS